MNYDEFKAELDKTPELMGDIYKNHKDDFTKHLTDNEKMVVTTMDEYKKTTQTAIDKAIKDGHTAWEAKVEQLTGLKRPEGKKGLEWFDEVSTKLKYMAEGDDAGSAYAKGLKKELDELKSSLKTEKEQTFKAEVNGKVEAGISSLKFATPSHIKKDDEIATYQKTKAAQMVLVFNSLYTAKKDESGQLLYVNGKGEAQTADGQPMTADQIAARDFASDLAPKGKSQGGTGSINDDPNATNEGYLAASPDLIEKKLAEMGKAYMSPEWEELYRKALKAIGKGI
ncbi:hypothetical protein GCM10028805_22580 [Spirosoma harenae]